MLATEIMPDFHLFEPGRHQQILVFTRKGFIDFGQEETS